MWDFLKRFLGYPVQDPVGVVAPYKVETPATASNSDTDAPSWLKETSVVMPVEKPAPAVVLPVLKAVAKQKVAKPKVAKPKAAKPAAKVSKPKAVKPAK